MSGNRNARILPMRFPFEWKAVVFITIVGLVALLAAAFIAGQGRRKK
jgi:hypothetical protein